MTRQIICAACEAADPEIIVIGGLRRTFCPHCHHSQRIDIEPFDYTHFAMGSTGVAAERLRAQADFIARRLSDGARALEIGCAAGDLAQALRECRSFVTYDGVEFSPARERAAKRLDTFSTLRLRLCSPPARSRRRATTWFCPRIASNISTILRR